jgi:hypothetical protein
VTLRALGDAILVLFSLVIRSVWQMAETALAALLHYLLRNGPSDRTIIRNAENQTFFVFEGTHGNISC